MISWVLILGIVNLLMGYGVAAYLADPPPWSGWTFRRPAWPDWKTWLKRIRRPAPAPGESSAGPAAAPAAATPATALAQPLSLAGIEELPPQWLDQLAEAGIVSRSYVEASAQVMRLEVGRYREQLLTAENRARANLAHGDASGQRLLADDLRFINQDWLEKQTQAADMLAERTGRLGEHEAAAGEVEQALLDQAARIRQVSTVLETLEFAAHSDSAGKQLLEQIGALVDSAHTLRDRMLDLLATLLRAGGQLAELAAGVQHDHLTGLPNRIGVEVLLDQWWREDPERQRALSVVLVDIDRFARINERLGPRGGDRVLVGVARLLGDLVRKNRGYDRISRSSGETFLVLLGDTGPHNALTAAERARQTMEATTFDDQAAELELTVSCGVVEVRRGDQAADVLRRAAQCLQAAKRGGRNRCALDEGQGPALCDPPQLSIKGRVVNLGEA